ncbi:MAG: immunity 26/phosphotriesterase HocA family protein [Spirochaetota bacterium]
MIKKRLKPGVILEIPIEKRCYCYARFLEDESIAFYDLKTKQPTENIETIVSSSVLFITLVYTDSVKERWNYIGHKPLEEHLLTLPPMFVQNPLNVSRFKIHYQDGSIKNATKEEVIGLERFAAWEAWAIEERLNDHFAGRKNKYVEEMRNPDLYRRDVKVYPERVKKLIEGLQ